MGMATVHKAKRPDKPGRGGQECPRHKEAEDVQSLMIFSDLKPLKAFRVSTINLLFSSIAL